MSKSPAISQKWVPKPLMVVSVLNKLHFDMDALGVPQAVKMP
jgi:hypothetical protein